MLILLHRSPSNLLKTATIVLDFHILIAAILRLQAHLPVPVAVRQGAPGLWGADGRLRLPLAGHAGLRQVSTGQRHVHHSSVRRPEDQRYSILQYTGHK